MSKKKLTAWQLYTKERNAMLVNEKVIAAVKCTFTPRREHYHNTKTARTYGVAGKGVVAVPFDKPTIVPSGIFNQMMMSKENCSAKDNQYMYKISVVEYYDHDKEVCDFVSIMKKEKVLEAKEDIAVKHLKDGNILDGLKALGLINDDNIGALAALAAKSTEESTESKPEVPSADGADGDKGYYTKFVEKDKKWKVYENGSDESKSVKNFDEEADALKYIESLNIP